MSDMSDLSAATATAVEAAVNEPAPEPEPVEEIDLDPGEDETEESTFPLEYVQKLRREAADKRTKLKSLEEPLAAFEPDERDAFLQLGQLTVQDPASALPEYERIVATIRDELGLTEEEAEAVVEAHAEAEAEAEGEPKATPKFVTAEEAARVAREAAAEQRAEEQAAEEAEARQQAIFDKALELDEGYTLGSDRLVQLFHVAQTNPEAGGTLEGAHEILMGRLDAYAQQVIQDYRDGLRDGTRHPPTVKAGETVIAEEDPDAFQKMTVRERQEWAKRRADERLARTMPGS